MEASSRLGPDQTIALIEAGMPVPIIFAGSRKSAEE